MNLHERIAKGYVKEGDRCWYSGVVLCLMPSRQIKRLRNHTQELKDKQKRLFMSRASEHCIIPRKYFGEFRETFVDELPRNWVFTCDFIASMACKLPVSLRFELRERIHVYMNGRDEFKPEDYANIKQIKDDICSPYKVGEVPVWVDARLSNYHKDVFYHSTANPFVNITNKDLDRRARLLRELADADREIINEYFGIDINFFLA